MEAAGDLIAPAAELAAGVQNGENHLQGALAGLLLGVHGDAAAVVGDADHVALFNGHLDMGAEARQGFVDGVVHDLIHQVVQARGGGGADVHARPLPHCLQSLQHLDLGCVIFLRYFFNDVCHSSSEIPFRFIFYESLSCPRSSARRSRVDEAIWLR